MPELPKLDPTSDPRSPRTPSQAPEGSRPPGPSAANAELIAGPERHLADYVKVLYKRRWTAFTAFALVFGGVTVYTFTATPLYEARTRLLIETDEQNVVSFKQVVDENQTPGGLLPDPVQRAAEPRPGAPHARGAPPLGHATVRPAKRGSPDEGRCRCAGRRRRALHRGS